MKVSKSIAHFAPIQMDERSGMGRVAVHWREALVRRGWAFRHYGTEEVPLPKLKPLWAYSARRTWRKMGPREDLLLVHEPSAETLRGTGIPTVLFSHGLEARCAELAPDEPGLATGGLRNRLMTPLWLWRSQQRERGLRRCPLLLLINQEDKAYAIDRYGRSLDDIFVFRNGVDPSPVNAQQGGASGPPTVLFYGSWLERKGKSVLVRAAIKLAAEGQVLRWLLVGTGKPAAEVLHDWPIELRDSVVVKPHVAETEDDAIYAQATAFVLPSFFEGQPLTLLQAMESGRCVITSNCCGQKDIVQHGHNGFLFESGDADALARHLAAVLADKDRRMKVGAQAKTDMAARRWPDVSDEVAKRLEQFLEETCARE
jgi:glycosyltransferase involved in cell wall biosynthesis